MSRARAPSSLSLNAKYYVLEDLADRRGTIETVKNQKFESEK
jgi:hypothetical protein